VSDAGMEQLVNEKVEAFWKGIEGGANKRGQVRQFSFRSLVMISQPVSRSMSPFPKDVLKNRGFKYTWEKRMCLGNNGSFKPVTCDFPSLRSDAG
jgi:hypothetical protein